MLLASKRGIEKMTGYYQMLINDFDNTIEDLLKEELCKNKAPILSLKGNIKEIVKQIKN